MLTPHEPRTTSSLRASMMLVHFRDDEGSDWTYQNSTTVLDPVAHLLDSVSHGTRTASWLQTPLLSTPNFLKHTTPRKPVDILRPTCASHHLLSWHACCHAPRTTRLAQNSAYNSGL